jgi:release factor glutamine methyltransferase
MMPESDELTECASVAQLHRWGTTTLGGEEARRESELLLGHALQCDRAWLFAHADDVVDRVDCATFRALVERRVHGEPVAQLLGRWGFWSLDLRITRDTLIPRPETELLVEAALARMPTGCRLRVADMGTGSGAIALAIARERPDACVFATDASVAALDVARANAVDNEVGNVEFRHGDWYRSVSDQRFDLIVSNPPYIAATDPHLQGGDLRHEPVQALASGSDGLDAIRVLIANASAHLTPNGWILLEHGHEQGEAVRALMNASQFSEVHSLRDLEQRERVTIGRAR